MQVLRLQWPEVQTKSTGHMASTVQAVAAQWWSVPQLWPVAQSVSVLQPGWQPVVAPQAQGTEPQIDGPDHDASMEAQSESTVQGGGGAGQMPPQTC